MLTFRLHPNTGCTLIIRHIGTIAFNLSREAGISELVIMTRRMIEAAYFSS